MAFSSSQPPLYSIRSDKGRRANMEDRHDIRVNFMELPLDPTDLDDVLPKYLNTPVRSKNMNTASSGDLGVVSRSSKSSNLCGLDCRVGPLELFHMFSVFDGHGGYRAAEHCAEKLAQNLKSTLTRTLRRHALPIKELVRQDALLRREGGTTIAMAVGGIYYGWE